MIAGVADTHTAIWHLFDDPMLSPAARKFTLPRVAALDDAAEARQKIALSPISLAEVVYLIEKRRLPMAAYTDLRNALRNPNHVLEEAPFTMEVVEAMQRVARSEVPDMPDRIVAATAVYLGVPVISRDRRIRTADLRTVW
jgi:PIN domain nuclease of toxin-antitoxin system